MEFILSEVILARFGLGDPEWLDPATAAVIVLIGFVVAFLVHKLIFPLFIRFTRWTPTDLDSRLIRSLPLANHARDISPGRFSCGYRGIGTGRRSRKG
ncbi:MAG: hypothetical protein CM1200mP27_01130 [Chloroflexota bacterium]|nr:MAG: hypothetical protein CM1200mP27_01130 [Chloroflexota bacterium]